MNKEDREWLDQLIEENKESDNELTYTYCPFSVLYALQQENQELINILKIIRKDINFVELCDGYIIENKLNELEDGNNE